MQNKITKFSAAFIVFSLLLAGCGNIASVSQVQPAVKLPPVAQQPQPSQPQQTTNTTNPAPAGSVATSLSGYESSLENIYAMVNPSVVSIRVVEKQTLSSLDPNSPFSSDPNGNQPSGPQFSAALGSGFVWSQDGYIVTNNHVVSGATNIQVKFADGTIVPATLVGADPDSDLAVVKVANPGFALTPIKVSDSTLVKVGQVGVAIGNPFGLENTMTVGIVSALGRSLPAGQANSDGSTYTIPDVIQTDAAINPGNSGGPLVDDQGALIGVNSDLISSSGSNSGVGFAIPSSIVSRVVPELIKNGKYEHSYLGISGLSLNPDLATAMKLDATQRGALVETVAQGGPAEKAGLKGSETKATIYGQDVLVGGDLIIAIDGSPVKTIEDVIAYLADHTSVGQKVTLTILRDGKQQTVDVTLAPRPVQPAATTTTASNNNTQQPVWLGIAGQALTPEINKEMNLPQDQAGVLVEQVQAGSPADQAGLQGSFKPVIINGQRVLVGGDVITAIDGKALTSFDELKAYISTAKAGQQVTLTILRDGKQQTLTATLAERP